MQRVLARQSVRARVRVLRLAPACQRAQVPALRLAQLVALRRVVLQHRELLALQPRLGRPPAQLLELHRLALLQEVSPDSLRSMAPEPCRQQWLEWVRCPARRQPWARLSRWWLQQ